MVQAGGDAFNAAEHVATLLASAYTASASQRSVVPIILLEGVQRAIRARGKESVGWLNEMPPLIELVVILMQLAHECVVFQSFSNPAAFKVLKSIWCAAEERCMLTHNS